MKSQNELHQLADQNDEIVKNITTFMKRNKNLMHMDLSNCNITEHMLWGIAQSLTRCKSLVCVHLSGN